MYLTITAYDHHPPIEYMARAERPRLQLHCDSLHQRVDGADDVKVTEVKVAVDSAGK